MFQDIEDVKQEPKNNDLTFDMALNLNARLENQLIDFKIYQHFYVERVLIKLAGFWSM